MLFYVKGYFSGELNVEGVCFPQEIRTWGVFFDCYTGSRPEERVLFLSGRNILAAQTSLHESSYKFPMTYLEVN